MGKPRKENPTLATARQLVSSLMSSPANRAGSDALRIASGNGMKQALHGQQTLDLTKLGL